MLLSVVSKSPKACYAVYVTIVLWSLCTWCVNIITGSVVIYNCQGTSSTKQFTPTRSSYLCLDLGQVGFF